MQHFAHTVTLPIKFFQKHSNKSIGNINEKHGVEKNIADRPGDKTIITFKRSIWMKQFVADTSSWLKHHNQLGVQLATFYFQCNLHVLIYIMTSAQYSLEKSVCALHVETLHFPSRITLRVVKFTLTLWLNKKLQICKRPVCRPLTWI